MEFIDYLTYVAVWIVGAVYGWYARERQARRTIERLFSEIEESAEEDTQDSLIMIDIERDANCLYAYNKETSEFLAQGKSRRELEETLAKRYPDQRFMASKETLKVLNEPF